MHLLHYEAVLYHAEQGSWCTDIVGVLHHRNAELQHKAIQGLQADWCACLQQAYDIIMDENKALRDFEDAEVAEDPLVILACGHVLPMTSMDGYLELHKAYETDRQGIWRRPCQLQVRPKCSFTAIAHSTMIMSSFEVQTQHMIRWSAITVKSALLK